MEMSFLPPPVRVRSAPSSGEYEAFTGKLCNVNGPERKLAQAETTVRLVLESGKTIWASLPLCVTP
jgi:hypothetical protein